MMQQLPRRLPTADAALQHLLRSRTDVPFRWGESDCALWAADAVHAVTGTDFAAAMRGRYSTAAQARSLLRPLGGLHGLLASTLRPAPALDLLADGDVALTQPDGLHRVGALAVRVRGWVIGQGADGLVMVPRSTVISWWRAFQ